MRTSKYTFKEIADNPHLRTRYGIHKNVNKSLMEKDVLVVLVTDDQKNYLVGRITKHRKINNTWFYFCEDHIFTSCDVLYIVDIPYFYRTFGGYRELKTIPQCIEDAREKLGYSFNCYQGTKETEYCLTKGHTDNQLICMHKRKTICAKCYRKDKCNI